MSSDDPHGIETAGVSCFFLFIIILNRFRLLILAQKLNCFFFTSLLYTIETVKDRSPNGRLGISNSIYLQLCVLPTDQYVYLSNMRFFISRYFLQRPPNFLLDVRFYSMKKTAMTLMCLLVRNQVKLKQNSLKIDTYVTILLLAVIDVVSILTLHMMQLNSDKIIIMILSIVIKKGICLSISRAEEDLIILMSISQMIIMSNSVQLKHVLKQGSSHPFYGTQVSLGIISVLMCTSIGKRHQFISFRFSLSVFEF